MSECEFTRVPRSLTVVFTLQKLDLSKNHIDVCPTSFGQLSNLADLDLKGNQLSVLPRELENLAAKLVNLNMSNNNFEVCPFVIFRWATFSFHFPLISSPHDFFRVSTILSLTNLKTLDMSFCRLSSLPQQIQNLSNVSFLSSSSI